MLGPPATTTGVRTSRTGWFCTGTATAGPQSRPTLPSPPTWPVSTDVPATTPEPSARANWHTPRYFTGTARVGPRFGARTPDTTTSSRRSMRSVYATRGRSAAIAAGHAQCRLDAQAALGRYEMVEGEEPEPQLDPRQRAGWGRRPVGERRLGRRRVRGRRHHRRRDVNPALGWNGMDPDVNVAPRP